MIKLVISDNEGSTTVVPLVRDEISIGRQEGNTIRLTERNVSRKHARLVRQGGHYLIEDLGSYNGIFINGEAHKSGTLIRSGDCISIGDYSLQVHSEVQTAQAEGGDSVIPVRAPPVMSVAPRPTTPARVVMLSAPSPGAEFSLSNNEAVRLGRSEDLPIPINHRSVSREHAEVVPFAGGHVIKDLGSANGMFVNRRKLANHTLVSGDVFELGQVAFRFVGPGEAFFFSPNDGSQYGRATGLGSKGNARLAIAMVIAAVLIAGVVLSTGDETAGSAEADEVNGVAGNGVAAAAPSLPEGSTTVTVQDAVQPQSDREADYAKALLGCRAALDGQRFTEASAHGALALAARPGDEQALACQSEGQRRFLDDQAFARGQAALVRGQPEKALNEFAAVSVKSPLRARDAWQKAMTTAAEARLRTAQDLLRQKPKTAAAIAADIAELQGIAPEAVAAARELQKQALLVARKQAGATGPARATALRVPKTTKKNGTAQKRTVAKRAARPKPLEVANRCLAKGDNRCVIAALAGKARSEREMAMLIETYRAVGNGKAARKHMGIYVKRFRNTKRRAGYLNQLRRARK